MRYINREANILLEWIKFTNKTHGIMLELEYFERWFDFFVFWPVADGEMDSVLEGSY